MDVIQKIETPCSCTKFKQSPLAHMMALILFITLAAGTICWFYFGNFPLAVALSCSGIMGLFGLLSFISLKKSLALSNWVLAIGSDLVFIKFRSYLNSHFPQMDPQVIRVRPAEIESTCITKQKITQYGLRGGRRTTFHTFLDMNMVAPDLFALQEQLKYEQNRIAPLTGRLIRSRSKSKHRPVSVVDNRTIRIEWRSPSDMVVPKISKAIRLLSDQGIMVNSLKKEVLDMTLKSADKKSTEDRILFLAQQGDVLGATRLARRGSGMSLTEAKKFVEELGQ
jgi:hypothetical protein